METILIYSAEPLTIPVLPRIIRALNESGYFVHGLINETSETHKVDELGFDSYQILTKNNIDNIIKINHDSSIRMTLVFDFTSTALFGKLLLHFNIVSFIFDNRFCGGLSKIISNKLLPFHRRLCTHRDINESDLIVSFSSKLLKNTIQKKQYRGQKKHCYYFSEISAKYCPPPKHKKLYCYIPGVYNNSAKFYR